MKKLLLFIGLILPLLTSAHDWKKKAELDIAGLTTLKYYKNELYALNNKASIVTVNTATSVLTTVVDFNAVLPGISINAFAIKSDGSFLAVSDVSNKLYFLDSKGVVTNEFVSAVSPQCVLEAADGRIWVGGIDLEIFTADGNLEQTFTATGSSKKSIISDVRDLMLLSNDKVMMLDRNRGISITEGNAHVDGYLECSKKYKNNDTFNKSQAVAESADFFMVLSLTDKSSNHWGVNQFDKKLTTYENIDNVVDNVVVKVSALKSIAGSRSEVFVSTTDKLFIYENSRALASVDLQKVNVSIYPNPVIEILNVKSNDLISSFEIYNVLGSIVSKGAIDSNETALNVSSLISGMYIIKLYGTDHKLVYSSKFTKN
ncbi:T9SS type A sorting domain-containing protein [Halosquirtibacter xylanolyticus]|uniref:T9SS type A sorting domain-containing protein n=1 Tax=Halosquirtibacter xylanolyticus TaxID=3374599 RepID=UPI003749534B|nr:T9SS type A sorting domain-containing protein [Prolixibacteraceae bacterium]